MMVYRSLYDHEPYTCLEQDISRVKLLDTTRRMTLYSCVKSALIRDALISSDLGTRTMHTFPQPRTFQILRFSQVNIQHMIREMACDGEMYDRDIM